MYSATVIVAQWTKRGSWSQNRRRRLAKLTTATHQPTSGPDVLAIVNYPDVVTLADLLCHVRWSHVASAAHRHERLPFDQEVARRLDLGPGMFASNDPLVAWQEGEALVRRQRLHQHPDYRGPEVWLSLA